VPLFYTWTTNPGGTDFWVLPVNNSDGFLGAFTAALALLTDEGNWQLDGAITVQQAAIAASEMFADMFKFPDPVGMIIPYGGAAGGLPPGALLCDGASYPTTSYPALFGVIGYAYGGAGANFNVPDLRSKVATGAGGSILGNAVTLGSTGGAESHSQTLSELAAHTHADAGHTHGEGTATPSLVTIGAGVPQVDAVASAGITGSGNASIQNAGGGAAMPTFPPYVGVNYIIITGQP
jgi:microcystin-dependent protein